MSATVRVQLMCLLFLHPFVRSFTWNHADRNLTTVCARVNFFFLFIFFFFLSFLVSFLINKFLIPTNKKLWNLIIRKKYKSRDNFSCRLIVVRKGWRSQLEDNKRLILAQIRNLRTQVDNWLGDTYEIQPLKFIILFKQHFE